jgi:hypothetical protein
VSVRSFGHSAMLTMTQIGSLATATQK